MKRFRGLLVFEAHKLVYRSTLGLRVMKKKKLLDTIHEIQLCGSFSSLCKLQKANPLGRSYLTICENWPFPHLRTKPLPDCNAGPSSGVRRDVKRFRGGLVFKVHKLVYHSLLGCRLIKKNKTRPCLTSESLPDFDAGPSSGVLVADIFFFMTLEPTVE